MPLQAEIEENMESIDWNNEPDACFMELLIISKYSENTIKPYASVFGHFVRFLNEHSIIISSANECILKEWLIKCAVNDKTENRYLYIISLAFANMLESGLVEENWPELLIAKKKKLKKGRTGKREVVALDERQFRQLCDEYTKPGYHPRMRVVVQLLIGCGLRVSELCDLKASDVHLDLDAPYLTVIGKGDKERSIPIPDEIIGALRDQEAALPSLNGYFVGVEHNSKIVPYTPSGIYRMIQKMMQAAGIVKERMSPHVLRHTYATRQLQGGVPVAILKMWMGHESIITTIKYEHSVQARGAIRPKF